MFAAATAAITKPVGEVYFLLSDHLGSTMVTLNLDGSVQSEIRYKACPLRGCSAALREGETRYTSGTTPTDRQYTGQINESELGLYFYNARWYDPALGRFTQPDSIIPQPGSPLGWDRYAYTLNNPVNWVDPTGHIAIDNECGRNGQDCDYKRGNSRKWHNDNSYLPKPGVTQACGGGNSSILCRNNTRSELKFSNTPYDTSCPNGRCNGNTSSSSPDYLFEYLRLSNQAVELYGTVEDGIEYGRPIYKQAKYLASFGPWEYGVDGLLQLYDDRYRGISIPQRFERAGIRVGESLLIDQISIGMGSLTAIGIQMTVPIPIIPTGVGYIIGAYSTSSILTNIADHYNPILFANLP